jgi:hypothetical protein
MAKTTSSSGSKPKGLSLHIGLNAVSPAALRRLERRPRGL